MTKHNLILWLCDLFGEPPTPAIEESIEKEIDLVIADYEAGKWKKYPENKPTEGIECAVVIDEDGIEPDIWVYRSDRNKDVWDKFIKMFYELPKPYKETK